MTNLQKGAAIFKRLVREKKAQPGGQWDKSNIPMAKKIMIKAIADELTRIEKVKLGSTEQAEAIYKVYPRAIARTTALTAIEKALALMPYDELLERTTRYAEAVERWSHDYRFRGSAGSDIVPHPASWFNAGRYNDDPKEWVGDRRYNIDPTPKSKSFAPPNGWQMQLTMKYPDFEPDGNGVKRASSGKHLGWNDLPTYIQKELAA